MHIARMTLGPYTAAITRLPVSRLLGSTLSIQFLVTGGVFMLLGMGIVGWLFGDIVSRDVIRTRAVSSALFMQSLTAPLVLDLETSPVLSIDAIHQLDGMLSDEASSQRFPHLEIWTPDSTIVYSRSKTLIGKRFTPPEGLTRALHGEIAAQFADLSAGEHVTRYFDTPHLEVYSPLRAPSSGKIIAVVEIHEQTAPLQEEVNGAWLRSWALVALATSIVMAGLFGIVHRGSRLIANQSAMLKSRAEEAELVSREVLRLKDRAQRASARVAELNEQFIRNIGADLHDGPSQHLSFIALQIEKLRRATSTSARERVIRTVAQAVDDALRELRAIAKQLLLPEIENLELAGIVERVTKLHRARTGKATVVEVIGDVPPLTNAVKICVFRFLQECLNNAQRYAESQGLKIRCSYNGKMLEVAVSNIGPPSAFAPPSRETGDTLGLIGLRERIESLGGFLQINPLHDGGRRIEMQLDLTGGLNLEHENVSYRR
jgi:signal transduction histidine kinase